MIVEYPILIALFLAGSAAALWLGRRQMQPDPDAPTEPAAEAPAPEEAQAKPAEATKAPAEETTEKTAQAVEAPAEETTEKPAEVTETSAEEETTPKPAETAAQPAEAPAPLSKKSKILYALCGLAAGGGAAYTVGLGVQVLPLLLAYIALGAAAYVDSRQRRIPNVIPLLMLVCSVFCLLLRFVTDSDTALAFVFSCLIGGAAGFVVLLLVSLLARGGFGMGDVKLLSALGALCGAVCLMGTLFFAVLLAALYSIFLLATKKGNLKTSMPFGPFIFAGFLAAIILGIC